MIQIKDIPITQNLYKDRYSERKEFLRQTIHQVKSDIMGLQEVAFLPGGQLHELVKDNDGNDIFEHHSAKMQISWQEQLQGEIAKECWLDGNSVIIDKQFSSKNKVINQSILHLSIVRVAHLLEMELQNKSKLYIVNTHLHHTIEDKWERLQQVKQIILWLKIKIPNFEEANIIFCGDFNATPIEECYRYVEESGFKSTHYTVHSEEPEITFPTGLLAPNMDTDPANCLDYIWYRGNIKPLNCQIFGNKCLETDPTIYPSDHMGLVSDFEIY